ncbi:pyridoxal-phosphate dependent enzyme [Streptomyces sp. NPDC059101]|uniref:pyridoxal-phosphate dependent enzyme n=1 Tax=unclassified Streptomyces TaxID=2593676 RepID=UPI0036756E15
MGVGDVAGDGQSSRSGKRPEVPQHAGGDSMFSMDEGGSMGITLTGFRRIPLGTWPTLLQEAPRLSEMIGRRVLIKRDDVGELGLAGNKVRKLEFLLGDAAETGADTVITLGALQSNHARLTAAAAARLGLRCPWGAAVPPRVWLSAALSCRGASTFRVCGRRPSPPARICRR